MHQMSYLVSLLFLLPAVAAEYPETREDGTIDSFHGIEVADPFRWLED